MRTEVCEWLQLMSIANMCNSLGVEYTLAAKDVEEHGLTCWAEMLIEKHLFHLYMQLCDPVVVRYEYLQLPIIKEIKRLNQMLFGFADYDVD